MQAACKSLFGCASGHQERLAEAERELERATANTASPDYPRRLFLSVRDRTASAARTLKLPLHVAAVPIPAVPLFAQGPAGAGEKGIAHELVRENPWERRDEFIDLNPAGETPVLVDSDGGITLIGSQPIVEYFEETVDRMPMIHGNAIARAEIRRLAQWFDEKLFREVVEPLMHERMRKRLVSRESPDTRVREVMRIANGHLDYLDYLLDHRRWLAGRASASPISPPRRICRWSIISARSIGAGTSRPRTGTPS